MRVALVTGGGRGIGRAIARALAGPDTFVAVASRTRSDLEATRARLDNALRANADSSTETMGTKQRLNFFVLGGVIWCVGMSFSIIASGKAGAAISYGLGQGVTVVAALWGIFIWKEFKNAPAGTSTILNIMLLLYVFGLALLISAR